jgi:RNA polymerase sigma factor (sigma-70 family)
LVVGGNMEWSLEAAELSTVGSSDARDLDVFCRDLYPQLVGMIGLYCGDRDLAEEVAQEALARACRHWSRLAALDAPDHWVTRVAFNLAKSTFRSRSVRRRLLERYGPSLGKPAGISDVDTVLAVRVAVAGLPERQRRALILRYFVDLPVADVACLMKCPEGTVKTLTRQAIEGLRHAGLEASDA